MAIIEQKGEYLLGTKKIEFDEIIEKAHDIHESFNYYPISMEAKSPIYMDEEENFFFKRAGMRNYKKSDITKYALGQACQIWGIPSRYVLDLYSKGLGGMVTKNIEALNKYNASFGGKHSGLKTILSDGVTEAVVSNRFAVNFPVCNVLETVKSAVDLDKYQPNQVYLSKSKMHIRFVDFENKEKVNGEDMSVGFTIDSSDVGKSALKVQFFLYKFACQNGIVVVKKGGTLYQQKHLGQAFDIDNIEDFKQSFKIVADLRQDGLDMVAAAQSRMMSVSEMHRLIDASRKNNISISERERNKIIDLAENRYGRTKWGFINGITEVAQNHTLDDRLSYEMWAGRLLQSKAV